MPNEAHDESEVKAKAIQLTRVMQALNPGGRTIGFYRGEWMLTTLEMREFIGRQRHFPATLDVRPSN